MQRQEFDQVFFGDNRLLEYAVDCPVRYEVWLAFAQDRTPAELEEAGCDPAVEDRHDLMLNAAERFAPHEVGQHLRRRLRPVEAPARIAVAGDFVVTALTFRQLVHYVLPMTSLASLLATLRESTADVDLLDRIVNSRPGPEIVRAETGRRSERWGHLVWLARLLVTVHRRSFRFHPDALVPSLLDLLIADAPAAPGGNPEPMVETVTINRTARNSVRDSRRTVKADAAGAVFEVSCASITWAILDSGIDALHPAFAVRDADGTPDHTAHPNGTFRSRVTRTYDFTGLRDTLADRGATVPDWQVLESELRVRHHRADYRAPYSEHGTHVAGILGAHWPEQKMLGLCPDIRLWDLRVLGPDGTGPEFNIVAALQFLRWINDRSARPVVAGANLSLALPHEVANYSCGWTPICVECDRLVRSGVVVVTVAGNAAFDATISGLSDGTSYRPISIADPGNADAVITVGATHRSDPHRHGVSYFSGRGPTADGRIKPDLLAPGEQVDGPVPYGGVRRMTGTSQAAPHVSGAAALLLARYRELLGRPERVKQVLLSTATDLGREKTFQGHGLLDVLRAMQAL